MGFTNDELYDLLSYDFDQFPGVNMPDGFGFMAPTNQQIETPGSTLSNDQHVELGSSFGSDQMTINNQTTNINQNIATGSTNSDQETSDSPTLENGLGSLPQHDTNFSFNPFLAMQQQSAYQPTTDFKTGSSSGGIYRPQFNQASNSIISQAPAVNYTNMPEQGMSSFDHLLQGGPEPYFPIMDSFGALDENNQQPGQDLMVSDYFTLDHSDSPLVGSQNKWQPGSYSIDSPSLTLPKPQSTSVVNLNPQPGVAQSVYPGQEINLVQPNRPISTYPENAHQTNNMLLRPQRAGLLSQGITPSFLDQPVDQNITNNNFSNTNHQSSFTQNSAELQVGNVNEGQRSPIPHQQQAVWPSNARNIPYRPSNHLEPQKSSDARAQFGDDLNKDNIFDSMIPENSLSSRPGEVTAQSEPVRSQQHMPPNIPNPMLHSPHFQSPVPSRSPQPLPRRPDQQNKVPAAALPSTAVTSRLNKSRLGDSSRLSRSSLQLPDKHDQNHNKFPAAGAAPSNAITSQRNKFKFPEILSRPIRSSDYPATFRHDPLKTPSWMDYLRPVTLAPKGYNLFGSSPSPGPSLLRNRSSSSKSNSSAPQHQNSKQRDPSEVDRRQKEYDKHSQQYEALLSPASPDTPPRANSMLHIPLLSRDQQRSSDQQPCKSPFAPDATDFRRGKSVLAESSRSSRPQDIGKFQGSPDPNSRSSVAITEIPSPPEVNSLTDKQKGKQKVLADSSSPFAFGESLFSSRIDKDKYLMLPALSLSDLLTKGTSLSRENNPQNANPYRPPPRIIKNSAYDPAFELLGIPIDPHLRMFAMNNTLPDCGNKRPRLDEP